MPDLQTVHTKEFSYSVLEARLCERKLRISLAAAPDLPQIKRQMEHIVDQGTTGQNQNMLHNYIFSVY